MILTRKNLKGGRQLNSFPLLTENGQLGYKLGYCNGCNEPILIKTLDTQEILSHLFHSQNTYKNLLRKLQPKIPITKKIIKWLIGKLGEYPVAIGDDEFGYSKN